MRGGMSAPTASKLEVKQMNRANKNDSWVKNPDGTLGFTSNIITGCLNGCSHCFARKLANGRLQSRYLDNELKAPPYGNLKPLDDPFWPRLWPERVEEIYARKKPAGIFLNIMGEWNAPWVPILWQKLMLDCIKENPHHRFYTLTHQPYRLELFSPYPDNCWVGATATNQTEYNSAVHWLSRIKAPARFISIEPLLSPINLHSVKDVDWIIVGQCTPIRKSTEPDIAWVRHIYDKCGKADTPLFLKENLRGLVSHHNELVCNECEAGDPCHACGAVMRFKQEIPVISSQQQ